MTKYTHHQYTDKDGRKCDVVIAHFAGKSVKGVSKCAVDDVYDADYGYQLAKARCDLKLICKRADRAVERTQGLADEIEYLTYKYRKAAKKEALLGTAAEIALNTLAELEEKGHSK